MSKTSEEILSLVINFENLLKGAEANRFDIKIKVLHLINNTEKATPNYLIEKLGMARSNLAIMCNKLHKDGYLIKCKEPLNKKEIFYCLTESGKALLNEHFDIADTYINKIRNKNKIVKLSKDLAKLI